MDIILLCCWLFQFSKRLTLPSPIIYILHRSPEVFPCRSSAIRHSGGSTCSSDSNDSRSRISIRLSPPHIQRETGLQKDQRYSTAPGGSGREKDKCGTDALKLSIQSKYSSRIGDGLKPADGRSNQIEGDESLYCRNHGISCFQRSRKLYLMLSLKRTCRCRSQSIRKR